MRQYSDQSRDQFVTDTLKTTSKRAIQKTQEQLVI